MFLTDQFLIKKNVYSIFSVVDALYVHFVYKSLLVITQFFQVVNELLLIYI